MSKKITNKIVGIKQCLKFLKTLEDITEYKFYVAKDADSKIIQPLIELANTKEVEINYVATMKELGLLCSIDVGAAVALFKN